jgi:dihydroneopterin aldolase
MATISIEKVHLYGKHGCYEAEATIGGHYELNVHITTDITKAAKKDELEHTVDYESVYELCVKIFGTRHKLLESLVYKMAHSIKDSFKDIKKVRVDLAKLHPPLAGQVGKCTVSYVCK